MNPQNPEIVYQGAVSLFRYFDGGATWNTRSGGHVDYHALAFDGLGNLYVGSNGGIFRINSSDQLFSLNNGVSITQLYPGVALDATNPAIAQAGFQDNGSDKTTGDVQWRIVCGGDGAFHAGQLQHCSSVRSWKLAAQVRCGGQTVGVQASSGGEKVSLRRVPRTTALPGRRAGKGLHCERSDYAPSMRMRKTSEPAVRSTLLGNSR